MKAAAITASFRRRKLFRRRKGPRPRIGRTPNIFWQPAARPNPQRRHFRESAANSWRPRSRSIRPDFRAPSEFQVGRRICQWPQPRLSDAAQSLRGGQDLPANSAATGCGDPRSRTMLSHCIFQIVVPAEGPHMRERRCPPRGSKVEPPLRPLLKSDCIAVRPQ